MNDAMDRENYIDQLYQKVRTEVPITRAAYGASLDGWDVEPVLMDGQQIGVVIVKDGEIHISLDKQGALRHARRIIRNYVASALRRFGFLTTRSLGEPDVMRFLHRLGFQECGRDGRLVVLRLEKLQLQ